MFHCVFHGTFIGSCAWLEKPDMLYDLSFSDEQLSKDSELTGIRISKSFIKNLNDDNEMGGFFTSNLEANTKVAEYPGRLAVVIVEKGKQAVPDQYWGMHSRAVWFACQPIQVSDDFFVRLEVVGSYSSSVTYFHTLCGDTEISTNYPLFAKLAAQLDFVSDVQKLFNLEFREKSSEAYDSRSRSFYSFKDFMHWLLSCPIEIWTTRAVVSGEEGYIQRRN